MNIRQISQHIFLDHSGRNAFVYSSEIESIEWHRLSSDVTSIIFEINSVNPEVLMNIPTTVKSIFFTNVSNPHFKFDLLPPHLEIFLNGQIIRYGEMNFRLFNNSPIPSQKRKRNDGCDSKEKCIKICSDSEDESVNVDENDSADEVTQNHMRL